MSITSSPMTTPFWEAAADGRLVVPQCSACGRRFFTPEVVCPYCFNADWTWVGSEGRGRVYSFTVVHRAADPAHQSDTPFALAVVDLDDGWSMLARLTGVPVDEVRVGLGVRVCFEPLNDLGRVPMFEPDPIGGT